MNIVFMKRILLVLGLVLMPLSIWGDVSNDLSFSGRIDTRYQFKYGDNASDNDVYQYHSFQSQLGQGWELFWFGGIRKDLDGMESSVNENYTTEKSDVSFRGLPDAVNSAQNIEYRVYSAYFERKSAKYNLSLGRFYLYDYEYSEFDGIKGKFLVFNWLFWEVFFGKPWQYDYTESPYYNSKELIGGTGLKMKFLDRKLRLDLKYIYIKEETPGRAIVVQDSDANTSISEIYKDHLVMANLFYRLGFWLAIEGKASYLSNSSAKNGMRDARLAMYGSIEKALLEYRISYFNQLLSISDFGNRFNQFSAFLTSSEPYHKINIWVSKSLADLFDLSGPLSDIQIEAGFDMRRPIKSENESRFNPNYIMLRSGISVVTNDRLYFLVFVENYKTSGEQNDTLTFGGELSKRWAKLQIAIGSAFFAYKYSATYSNTLVSDEYNAREYYLKLKWRPSNILDMSIKGSFETAEATSLTEVNIDTKEESALIYNQRNYYRIDVNIGARY